MKTITDARVVNHHFETGEKVRVVKTAKPPSDRILVSNGEFQQWVAPADLSD